MPARLKHGLLTASAFAGVGLLVCLPVLFGVSSFLMYPGLLVLRLFMSPMTIGHGGGVWLVFATNPVCFGILGFLAGQFLRTRRQVRVGVVVFVVAAVLAEGAAQGAYAGLAAARRAAQIEQLKEQALAKLRQDPNDAYSLHWMGVHHFDRTRDYDEAARYFGRLAEAESAQGEFSGYGQRALIYLAIIHKSRGRVQEAEEMYRRFVATRPDFERDTALRNLRAGYLRQELGNDLTW